MRNGRLGPTVAELVRLRESLERTLSNVLPEAVILDHYVGR